MSKYLPYHAASAAYARQLTSGIRDLKARYDMITGWIRKNIIYDYIKAAKVTGKKGIYPDPADCWKTHIGICQDIAALTVNMLRAAGVTSYLCIGHADRNYHAWVESRINGQVFRYDHSGKAQRYIKEKVF